MTATRVTASAEGEPAPIAWARSGAMALTGLPGGMPSAGTAAVATRANRLAGQLRVRFEPGVPPLNGAALPGERAAILGLTRQGRVSPGGSCRLFTTADGDLAVNLARPDDLELLTPWLEREVDGIGWDVVAEAVLEAPARHWVERGRLMGLAVAEALPPESHSSDAVQAEAVGTPRPRSIERPRILDLSSLWAGPLCTHLLGLGGAEIVKLESRTRPDGARSGALHFFDLLNAGKASVVLDFGSARGRDQLRRWIAWADVVVDASRPRALRQLGIEAEAILAEQPGLVWLSITGHGRREPEAQWVAFGDDAAVAAGLAVAAGTADSPVFCADAIADPLAGLEAAVEVWHALDQGGGCLLDISLAGAARRALDESVSQPFRTIREEEGWAVECEGERATVAPPVARTPRGRARAFGADPCEPPC